MSNNVTNWVVYTWYWSWSTISVSILLHRLPRVSKVGGPQLARLNSFRRQSLSASLACTKETKLNTTKSRSTKTAQNVQNTKITETKTKKMKLKAESMHKFKNCCHVCVHVIVHSCRMQHRTVRQNSL